MPTRGFDTGRSGRVLSSALASEARPQPTPRHDHGGEAHVRSTEARTAAAMRRSHRYVVGWYDSSLDMRTWLVLNEFD
jgi:hypothetical protein